MANRRDVASPILMRLDSESGQAIRLDRPLTIVGSKLHSHLRIVSPAISGSHALLLNLGNHVFLRDLMSRTHVFVNDRQVAEGQLKYGDVIQFGEMRFRFVDANVVRDSPSPARSEPATLRFHGRPDPVVIETPLFVFGRQAGADHVLDSSRVSKAHAVLYMQGGGWMLRDLGSREGTFVDGAEIRTIALSGGEVIRIGRMSFTFDLPVNTKDGEIRERGESRIGGNPATDESGDRHVFVADAVVISGAAEPFEDVQPEADPVAEFPADQAAASLNGLEIPATEAIEVRSDPQPLVSAVLAGLSEPVDLDLHEASTAQGLSSKVETGIAENRNDPLARILGGDVLTLYSGDAQSSPEAEDRTPAAARHRRRIRPGLFVALGATLAAAAAGGAWLYVHRS